MRLVYGLLYNITMNYILILNSIFTNYLKNNNNNKQKHYLTRLSMYCIDRNVSKYIYNVFKIILKYYSI